jgi:hypothetical protein
MHLIISLAALSYWSIRLSKIHHTSRMMPHHPREISCPSRHLISESTEDSVHSSQNLFLIMSQMTSQVCNLGGCMPNNALDQLNLIVVTDIFLMVAIQVLILARNRVFQMMDCCL